MAPEIVHGIGAIVLLGALGYAAMFWRKRNRQLDRVTEAATRQNYEAEERKEKREGNA
jgi:hypothetical protein